MGDVERDPVLAEQLASVLPAVVRAVREIDPDGTSRSPAPAPASVRAMLAGRHGDPARAVAVELEAFLDAHPDVASRASTLERDRLVDELRPLLASPDEHAARMLRTLLLDPEPSADRSRGWWAHAARWVSSDVLARSTAAIWMTLLIALPVGWAAGTHRLGHATVPDADVNTLAIRIFAVWALSFLPGWLYVRFLGQRAGALWNEYVLQLHRLGWDAPEHLPEPLSSSEYHAEWLRRGGAATAAEDNIYRQKFNAYYGRMVSEGTPDEDFRVRSQTMFPVFLSTIVLATGWVAVLWDTSFLATPTGLGSVLKYAFLGAYAFIVQSLIRRFFQSDLRPSAYAGAVLRIVLALIVVVPLYHLLRGDRNGAFAVAFTVGAMPAVGIQALHRAAATALRVLMPQMTPDYPLNQLDGLNVWYEARLVEEGIEDMQNLATANLVDVILHTRVPVGRLVDWIDQAHLYLHLDRVERGWAERWRTQHRAGRGSDDPADIGSSTSRAPDRAGARARASLRQLGIRTATDLLKVFPATDVESWPEDGPANLPNGLTTTQLRLLVRVLDAQPALVPVWNWQRRGPRLRERSSRSGRPRPVA